MVKEKLKFMPYSNMLLIPDGTPDTFFGVLAIVTITIVLYVLIYIELTKKRTALLRKAKRVAVEGLNLQKMKKQVTKRHGN